MEEEFKRFIMTAIELTTYDYTTSIQVSLIRNIPNKFFYDKDILIHIIKHREDGAIYIPRRFWDDETFILKLMKNIIHNYCFYNISDRLSNDREFILKLIEINPYQFEFFNNKFKEDEEIAFTCIKEVPWMLEYAKKFQNDKKIVMMAIKKDIECVKYVSDKLINDKEILYMIFKEAFTNFNVYNKIKDNKLKNEFRNNYLFTSNPHMIKNWKPHGKKKILDYLYIYVGHGIKFYNEHFDINFIYSNNNNKRKFYE